MSTPSSRHCIICHAKLLGRVGQKFCSTKCKNFYHVNLRRATNQATARIDKILHRNRSILLEVMGKKKKQIKIERFELDQRRFSFQYFTSMSVNKEGKKYYHVYDFRYMSFSDATVLILRK